MQIHVHQCRGSQLSPETLLLPLLNLNTASSSQLRRGGRCQGRGVEGSGKDDGCGQDHNRLTNTNKPSPRREREGEEGQGGRTDKDWRGAMVPGCASRSRERPTEEARRR